MTIGWYINNRSHTLWPTSNYPRRRQSLITSLAGAWGRTIGVNTSKVTYRSSASLRALMLPNSPPSIQTSSVSASMHSAMPLAGGMSMERNVAKQIPCPSNNSLLTHLPVSLLAALETAASRKVACRLLHENDTALSALNLYWRVGVDILDFRIVKLLPMRPLCFLNKLWCRFPLVGHVSSPDTIKNHHSS